MIRLAAGTLAGPLQGKRTSIPDRVPRQTRSSGEGLERASSSSASSSLTRDIGDPGWPGLLSSHNPPGAWDKSCHRAPAPLPSRRGPRWCQWVCQSISGLNHFQPALPLRPPLLTSPGIVPTAHCSPTCSPHSSFKRYLCPDRRLRLLPTTPAFSVASL